MDPNQQNPQEEPVKTSDIEPLATPDVAWVGKDEYDKKEAEKEAKEQSYRRVLKKRVRLASLILAFSVIALILIFATPLGSILPSFHPDPADPGSRAITASPVVGIVVAAAAISYIMLILDGGNLLKQRTKGSGKVKFLVSALLVLGLFVIFNPISIIFVLFLVFCNITVCVGT